MVLRLYCHCDRKTFIAHVSSFFVRFQTGNKDVQLQILSDNLRYETLVENFPALRAQCYKTFFSVTYEWAK